MKQLLLLLTILTTSITTYPQTPHLDPIPSTLIPIPSIPIPVTLDKMTNLIFPEAIQAAVKVSAEIIAQKVHGVDNVIEIKAIRPHFTATNLTVYGKDGQLYSFILHYIDDTTVLNFRILPTTTTSIQLSDLPVPLPTLRNDAKELEFQRPSLHRQTRTGHLTLHLTNICYKDSLEWLIFKITNHSTLDFQPETIRFYLQDKRKVRRHALQEIDLQPIFADQPELTFAFTPFHIAGTKNLLCEFRGTDGQVLTLKIRSLKFQRLSGKSVLIL